MSLLGLYVRLNLGYEGSQINQVRYPKVRSSGRNDKEWIFSLNARPARRQCRNIAEAVTIEDQIITPAYPSFNAVDFLSEQRVKGVRDSHGSGYFSSAACS